MAEVQPEHDDDGIHHPTGTMLIMSGYLLLMIAAWSYVFFVMSTRS